jgi:hypothetical protein
MTTHDRKMLQQLEADRAERFALRLTLPQLEAIAKDTRLPGEIAGTYGVTAAVIARVQHKARVSKSIKEAAARRHLKAAAALRKT